MKTKLMLSLLTLSLAIANAATMTVSSPLWINGTQLKPGDYKVEWEGSGPEVQVSILRGKNVIAKVPAKVVDLEKNAPNDAAVVKTNGDGSTTLAGLRFQGKKTALELDADIAHGNDIAGGGRLVEQSDGARLVLRAALAVLQHHGEVGHRHQTDADEGDRGPEPGDRPEPLAEQDHRPDCGQDRRHVDD